MSDTYDRSRVLVLGPGPWTIGEGSDVDAAAVAALDVLRLYEAHAILVSPNASCRATDPALAARTYIEPLEPRAIAAVIEREAPHGILHGFGGDRALELALALYDDGTLGRAGVALLGPSAHTIRTSRDRAAFEAALQRAGLRAAAREALAGDDAWTSLELEIALDASGGFVVACAIESRDDVGVAPGDAVSVTPPATLGESVVRAAGKTAREAARAIGLEQGVANVELAVRKGDGAMRVLALTPRVSRSSALALAATGYPVARVGAELALGVSLDELAVMPPAPRGVVVRWPRFAFEAFADADAALGPLRKSFGESLGLGSTLAGALRSAAHGADGGLAVGPKLSLEREERRVLVVGPSATRIGEGPELATSAAEALIAAHQQGFEPIFVAASPEACAVAEGLARVRVAGPNRVLAIYEEERAGGVIVQFGGDAAQELAPRLAEHGARVLGTPPSSLARASDRTQLEAVVRELGLACGRRDDPALASAVGLDVDAIADGHRVVVASVTELLEPPLVHGGDAAAILPAFTLSPEVVERAEEAVRSLALALGVVGLVTARLAWTGERLVMLEVELRAGRTTAFVSRVTGLSVARIATRVMLGETLEELGVSEPRLPRHVASKERVFPFERLGVDTALGPAMHSTGDVTGLADTPARAYAKALVAMGAAVTRPGEGARRGLLVRVTDRDRSHGVELARRMRALGFDVLAAGGVRDALRAARVPFEDLGEGVEPAAEALRAGGVGVAIVTATVDAEIAATRALRAAALEARVPCFTTVALAKLGCAAVEEDGGPDVRSLQEWYAADA